MLVCHTPSSWYKQATCSSRIVTSGVARCACTQWLAQHKLQAPSRQLELRTLVHGHEPTNLSRQLSASKSILNLWIHGKCLGHIPSPTSAVQLPSVPDRQQGQMAILSACGRDKPNSKLECVWSSICTFPAAAYLRLPNSVTINFMVQLPNVAAASRKVMRTRTWAATTRGTPISYSAIPWKVVEEGQSLSYHVRTRFRREPYTTCPCSGR